MIFLPVQSSAESSRGACPGSPWQSIQPPMYAYAVPRATGVLSGARRSPSQIRSAAADVALSNHACHARFLTLFFMATLRRDRWQRCSAQHLSRQSTRCQGMSNYFGSPWAMRCCRYHRPDWRRSMLVAHLRLIRRKKRKSIQQQVLSCAFGSPFLLGNKAIPGKTCW